MNLWCSDQLFVALYFWIVWPGHLKCLDLAHLRSPRIVPLGDLYLVDPQQIIVCFTPEMLPAGRLRPQQLVVVQFFSGPPGLRGKYGKCMEILLQVGECWGMDSEGDSYDCLGLCGAGCQLERFDLCSNWSQNCLKHDVCSYYYNSRGGAADPHCGWAFNIAAPDYLQPCLTDSTCTLPRFNTEAEVCQKIRA